MRTDTLRVVQVSAEAMAWLENNYKTVDAMDADGYRTFLAADCKLAFGNAPIVQCNNDIIGGIRHFWEAIGGLDHSFVNVLGTDQVMAAEAMIDYTREDGRVVTIPCVTIIERNNMGLASFIRIFIDTTPIFQP